MLRRGRLKGDRWRMPLPRVCADVIKTGPSKAIELVAFDAYKKLLSQLNRQRGEQLASPGPLTLGAAGAMAGKLTCPGA
jgi:hypothetical protein